MKHHESCVDKPGGYQYVLMDRFAAELMTGNNPGSQAAAAHCRGFCLYHVCFYIFCAAAVTLNIVQSCFGKSMVCSPVTQACEVGKL